jgi:hypothetical protein
MLLVYIIKHCTIGRRLGGPQPGCYGRLSLSGIESRFLGRLALSLI